MLERAVIFFVPVGGCSCFVRLCLRTGTRRFASTGRKFVAIFVDFHRRNLALCFFRCCDHIMDFRKKGYYHLYASSLADEIKRSLQIADFNYESSTAPIYKMAPIGTAPASRLQDDFRYNGHDAEDFRNNGRDTDDCLDLLTVQPRPDPAFCLPPRVLYGGTAGPLGLYGGDSMSDGLMVCAGPASNRPFPRYVNHPGVQTTQDIIRRAIIGGAAGGHQVGTGRPGNGSSRRSECVFCRNNGEERRLYQSHVLKDKAGKVTCPVLRVYVCPVCDASGDAAHTLRYCPLNKSRLTPSDLSATIQSTRTSSSSRRSAQRQLSG